MSSLRSWEMSTSVPLCAHRRRPARARRRIKDITGHREVRAKNKRVTIEYRVQWVGYDKSHDQWIRHISLIRCVCVCVCERESARGGSTGNMHAHTHTHTHTHTCRSAYMRIYIHTHTCIHTCIHTYICIYVYVCRDSPDVVREYWVRQERENPMLNLNLKKNEKQPVSVGSRAQGGGPSRDHQIALLN